MLVLMGCLVGVFGLLKVCLNWEKRKSENSNIFLETKKLKSVEDFILEKYDNLNNLSDEEIQRFANSVYHIYYE